MGARMLATLFVIESIRLFRRWLPWAGILLTTAFVSLSLHNDYVANAADVGSGAMALPGLSFDLATSLEQSLYVMLPFTIITGAALMGEDYAERTNQHWLIRASRGASVLAKALVLTAVILLFFTVALTTGGIVGLGLKTWLYGSASLAGVNAVEFALVVVYLTFVTLPYAALVLLLALITRSTFVGAAIAFGYSLVLESLVSSIFWDAPWTRWLPRSLLLSTTYLLDRIGNPNVAAPATLHEPLMACAIAAGYAAILLGLAIWIYRRQDVGG